MSGIKTTWGNFKAKHPNMAQFLVFFVISNGVTLLQLAMMPFLRGVFAGGPLEEISFQVFPVGQNLDGSQFYIFNYPAGAITAAGTGGGLAYFLAVQISLLIAQIINFFVQRNVTFKSNSSVGRAAMWYLVAYIVITLVAGALQGLYKVPIYQFFIGNMGSVGERIADIITMVINAAISFWIFFPIFKLIFKEKKAVAEQ